MEIEQEETCRCTGCQHGTSGSKYPKNNVPKRLFRKDPNDLNSKLLKHCIDCRNLNCKNLKEKREVLKILSKKVDPSSEFQFCTSQVHTQSVSNYPRDKVPKAHFRKDPNDPRSETCEACFDCRAYVKISRDRTTEIHRNEAKISKETDSDFFFCPCIVHSDRVSIYPRDKVPKSHFRKDPNDPKSEMYETCFDCRNDSRDRRSKKVDELKNEAEARKEIDANSDVKFCPYIKHNSASEYPRESVPKHMFRQFPEDPRSPLFENCSDCRTMENNWRDGAQNERRESVKEGEFYCRGCDKVKPCTDKGTNLDGEKSECCAECKIKQKNWKDESKKMRRRLKVETMLKNKCSCVKCKKIFLKPENDNYKVGELLTYEIDNIRYVEYKDKEYLVKDFIEEFEELLEVRILEYDHLSEEEQRERGLLQKGDVFIRKKKNVSQLHGENAIRLESLKTQLICSKCHVEETLRRQPLAIQYTKMQREKLVEIDKLKSEGCSICGFYDPTLHRFLEFDHLDPNKKVASISEMLNSMYYSLEELIKEIDKTVTRVTCRFCHAIHTDLQRQTGII